LVGIQFGQFLEQPTDRPPPSFFLIRFDKVVRLPVSECAHSGRENVIGLLKLLSLFIKMVPIG
jgi:hypothetical protein